MPSFEGAALSWIDQFNKGKFVVEVDTKGLEKSISSVSDIGRQATVGVIVVGQLIGTAIVMAILLQPSLTQFQGFAYLAMIAFGVTLVVSFIVSVPRLPAATRRGRRHVVARCLCGSVVGRSGLGIARARYER